MNLGTQFSPSQAGSSEFQDRPVQELVADTPALRGAGGLEPHLCAPKSVHSCFKSHGPDVGSQPPSVTPTPVASQGGDCLLGLLATCRHGGTRCER